MPARHLGRPACPAAARRSPRPASAPPRPVGGAASARTRPRSPSRRCPPRAAQAHGRAGVRAEGAGPAGVGEHGHSVAGRQGLVGEQHREVEHLPQRLGPQHPGMREQRVDGGVGGRKQRPVRDAARRLRPRRGRSSPPRSACARDPRARPPELARVAKRLQVEQQHRGLGVLLPVLRKSLPEKSALSPNDTNDENPMSRSAAASIAAIANPPLSDAKPTCPGEGARGATVALSAISGRGFATPRQPARRRIPAARHDGQQLSSTSVKPGVRTTRPRTPLAAQARAAVRTAAGGTASTASSTSPSTSASAPHTGE